MRNVILEGAALTLAGLAIGMPASAATGRFLQDLLFEVTARDPLVLAIVPLVAIVVSALAWIAPVRRAAEIDPVVVLKSS
jgi:ABC-type antimicrobial peptide transport system permease subunit